MAKGSGGTVIHRPSATEKASRAISQVISDINAQGYSRIKPFKIGKVEQRMKDYANSHSVVLGGSDVYMGSDTISHALRDSKVGKGIAVSSKELIDFPKDRKSMSLYYDKDVKTFLYVNEKSKFILHPNKKIKTESGKKVVVNFVTAQKLSKDENFNGKRFDKI